MSPQFILVVPMLPEDFPLFIESGLLNLSADKGHNMKQIVSPSTTVYGTTSKIVVGRHRMKIVYGYSTDSLSEAIVGVSSAISRTPDQSREYRYVAFMRPKDVITMGYLSAVKEFMYSSKSICALNMSVKKDGDVLDTITLSPTGETSSTWNMLNPMRFKVWLAMYKLYTAHGCVEQAVSVQRLPHLHLRAKKAQEQALSLAKDKKVFTPTGLMYIYNL